MSLFVKPVKHYQQFHVGVDIGKHQDHTAIVVVEDALVAPGTQDKVTFERQVRREMYVRKVERLRLKTEYDKVIERVGQVLDAEEMQGSNVFLSVDATSVGEYVTECMRKEYRAKRVGITEVLITGGMTQHWEGRRFHISRNALLDRLSLTLERGELALPKGLRGMDLLQEELRGLRRTAGWKLMPRWECLGEHDDLAMALAMALWSASNWEVPKKAPRVWG
jgi:hypothetical protein